MRYALNQREALTRLEDGDLEIDNRDVTIGRVNWTFFGSGQGGKTAVLMSCVPIFSHFPY